MPEEAERRLLVERYAGRVALRGEVAAHVARRTGRVCPAFIKELMRRAAQAMLERDGHVIEVRDADAALQDMIGAGLGIGARVLGAGSGIGFTAAVLE